MPRISKPLHYRYCQWTPSGPNLFSALSRALNSKTTALSRMETVGPANADYPVRRVVNVRRALGGGMAGSVIEWVEGRGQPVIDDPSADVAEIEPLLLEADGREFIESMSYFYLRENHVILSPSRALGPTRIESHWRWLITEARSIANMGTLRLLEVSAANRDLAQLFQGVKSVTIAPDPADGATHGGLERTITHRESLGPTLVDRILEVLADYGGRGVVPASFRNAKNSRDVRATVEFTFAGALPDGGEPFLDDLAMLVSALDDTGYQIQVPGAGLVTLDELRVRTSARVDSTMGQPDRLDLWTQMSEWLEVLIQSGTVREPT